MTNRPAFPPRPAQSLYLALILLALHCRAQDPSFEIASVKPTVVHGNISLRIFPGGRLKVTNLSLFQMIRTAFDLRSDQISGGPAWLDVDTFDIDAKAPESDATRPQVMAMLRTLLADKFQLVTERGIRDGRVYELVVAKLGPKLKTSTADESRLGMDRKTDDNQRGNIDYTIEGQKASIMTLVKELAADLQTSLVDKTGLAGEYDFKFDIKSDENGDLAASIIGGIERALGLKLRATRGPVEFLMVRHAAKPPAN